MPAWSGAGVPEVLRRLFRRVEAARGATRAGGEDGKAAVAEGYRP